MCNQCLNICVIKAEWTSRMTCTFDVRMLQINVGVIVLIWLPAVKKKQLKFLLLIILIGY